MRRFQQLFTLLFVFSIFVGIVHELSDHNHAETCEVCVLAHSPALIPDLPALVGIETIFEPFRLTFRPNSHEPSVLARNRSPPLS